MAGTALVAGSTLGSVAGLAGCSHPASTASSVSPSGSSSGAELSYPEARAQGLVTDEIGLVAPQDARAIGRSAVALTFTVILPENQQAGTVQLRIGGSCESRSSTGTGSRTVRSVDISRHQAGVTVLARLPQAARECTVRLGVSAPGKPVATERTAIVHT